MSFDLLFFALGFVAVLLSVVTCDLLVCFSEFSLCFRLLLFGKTSGELRFV